jgi:hypothetical protein
MSSNFSHPTQYEIGLVNIDGKDCVGMLQMASIYENIYSPVITGSVVLLDTDGNDFIGNNQIEGSEEIELEFTNADGEVMEFSGVLNGLRNKAVKNQSTLYTFDFTSQQVRENESNFITKKFNNVGPQDVVSEMIEKLGGETDKVSGQGLPMSFLGARKRPTDVIKYVLTHGVSQGSSSTEKGKSQKEESKGTTGFACWQTLDGYRFCSIDDILKGEGGNNAGTFTHRMQNHGLSMQEAMESVLDYDFKQIGDIQSKMRSGAFKNINISFDMDKGLYKEFEYNDDKNMTEKQKKIATKATRIMCKPFINERFENSCTKANDNYWDQSRRYLAQNTVRQNTFADQFGSFTLPPKLKVRAGDTVEIKIPKVESEKGGGYNEKHSGQYVIKQVGHHFMNDGKAYTKIETIRSTTQQDDASSTS